MNIGIISNRYKDENYNVTKIIMKNLNDKNIKPIIPVDINEEGIDYLVCDFDEFFQKIDCLIAVGGDGTLIKVSLDCAKNDVPVLLVNLGTLGYLANVEVSEIDEAIDRLTAGNFSIDERLMIKTSINNDDFRVRTIALNDVTVSKGIMSKIITVDVSVNGNKIGAMRGDGLIISTPTGSTAYNLSAGGPILEPHSNTLALTPVCPQNPFFPLVISADEIISISVTVRSNGDIALISDGNIVEQIKNNDIITIKKAKESLKLIKVFDKSHFEIFSKKYFHKY